MSQKVKNLPAVQETGVRKIPWRRQWLPAPVFLPGESHGQRSLAGYSPWGHKELDRTERLTLSLSSKTIIFLKKQDKQQRDGTIEFFICVCSGAGNVCSMTDILFNLGATLCRNLISLNRDQTGRPYIGSTNLNHWTTRKVPRYFWLYRIGAQTWPRFFLSINF